MSSNLDVDFRYVTEAKEAEAFASVVRTTADLYLDTETCPRPECRHYKRAGLIPAMSLVRLLQLYVPGHPVMVLDLFHLSLDSIPELAAALTAANGPATRAHNAVFDCGQLAETGLAIPQHRWRCTALQERHITCGVMVQGRKQKKVDKQGVDLDSEAFCWETADLEAAEEQLHRDLNGSEITWTPLRCDLASTAARRCGIILPKEAQRSDWSQPELDVEFQVKYSARDALILEPIDTQQLVEIKRDGLEKAVLLDNMCIEPVAQAQRRGIRLDPQRWPALIDNLRQERSTAEAGLLQAVSDGLQDIGERQLNRDMLGRIRNDKVNGWKPGSRDQVLRTFRKLGIELKDLSKTERGLCGSQHPAFLCFNTWKQQQSQVQAAESYLQHICPDGLIHGDIGIFSADSGRMSISRPSLQNIPRGPAFRSGIVALGPGRKLVGADFPQIEVRFAALIAGDPDLTQVFLDGLDIYKFTGSFLSGVDYAACTPQNRKLAKPVVLGLIFGLGGIKLAQYSRLSFGVAMDEQQAKAYRQEFFNRFSRLAAWHQEMGEEVDQAAYIPVEARSLLGRRRKLEGWKRRFTVRVNSPIQSSAGELAKACIAALPKELEKAGCRNSGLILACHDELILDSVAEGGEADAAAAVLARVMSTYGERMLGMPCPVESVVGNDWSEAKA